MFSNKLLYYIANYTLQHSFGKEILKILKNEKKLVIFDVGCYRGTFTKTMLNLVEKRKYKFYLFDINKNVKKYNNFSFFKNLISLYRISVSSIMKYGVLR